VTGKRKRKTMHYTAIVHREGKQWLAEFPDASGCQTFADSEVELAAAAEQALEGWLEAHLVDGKAPPRPRSRVKVPAKRKAMRVLVSPRLTVALGIRWTRHDMGLTQAQIAAKIGVSQQQIAKLEDPDENPTLKSLDRVARGIGLQFELAFTVAEPERARASGKRRAA
jgi:predicted RNase H-like HicB family nuclease/DNA-binding XRE family transcriptional regulator